jgi:hypothetical protein
MLWLYDDRRGENAPEILYTADATVALLAAGVAAGLVDVPVPARPTADVIDFRAARLARLGDGGPDA